METPIDKYLYILANKDGSDLYLSTGAPPCAKFQGKLKPLTQTPYESGDIEKIARAIMDEEQNEAFDHDLEMNLATSIANVGRFRINIFKQRNEVSIVARNINTEIPKFDDLGLPKVLKDVVMAKRGLVLFVGGTGSGKSTSLAALIDHRNATTAGHIITIEDPVEYVHKHKKSIINQREVGVDTRSFQNALKNTLRQAPDVILVGEIRERATMEHALEFAETGHLAISTLHANNANQALERIINLFPEERRPQLLLGLAQNIRAIVSQRLVPTIDKKRCAAVEVLLGTKTIQELILKSRLEEIKEIMQKSENLGMQTFDAALYHLFKGQKISLEEAIANADSPNNLRLRIKLSDDDAVNSDENSEKPVEKAPAPAPALATAQSFGELSLEAIEEGEDPEAA
jgi:twitching motility protein PilU